MAEGTYTPKLEHHNEEDKAPGLGKHNTQVLTNGIHHQNMDVHPGKKSVDLIRTQLSVTCSMRCERHPDEVLQRYCKTCNLYICIECITEKHVGHKLQKFTEIIKNKKTELSCTIEKTKSETVVDVERKLNKTRELRVEFLKESESRVEEVKQRAEFLKNQIDEVSEEVQNELCNLRNDYEDDFQNAEEKLSKSLNELQEMVKEYEVALSNDDHGWILKGCQNIGDEIEAALVNVNVPTDGPPVFRPGGRGTEVKDIFGQLEEDYEKFSDTIDIDSESDACLNKGTFNRQRNLPIRVRRDHKRGRNRKKLNLSADIRAPSRIKVAGATTEITAVLTLNTTEALIIANEPMDGAKICRVNRGILQTEKLDKVGRNVYDIALLDHRTLLFTEKKGTELYSYDLKSQKVAVKKSFSPNIVGGICCADDDVIVCCISDRVDYNVTEESKRSVVILSENEDQEFEFNGNSSTKLFTMPSRVTALGNSDLCVIDRLSEKRGRVVVFSQVSKVHFIYEGLKKNQSFDPTAVAVHRNSILIADRKFGIHELTSAGQFARYILNDSALWNPRSLAVDSESKAWIGCENGYILRMRIAQDCFSLMSIIDTETDA
ncbi:hypothetical protein FSP39_019016 [Pinctada imbricata]|uniref:B box-type domain-containing protein n=1 Tax=Pinctada imbricata TaxID=66713 RepID=A0AA88YIU7_PINIB|nr:hypothetical protein FSP39_019016 [Pinctada imbricata]